MLVQSGAHGLAITAVNERAAREGVQVGTSLADARAALPGLVSRTADPAHDARSLLKLARWLGRYGPARHCDGNDGVWIAVTGVAHLYGGEQALLDDLVRRLAAFGITARAGLASTFGAAHALARFATAKSGWAIAPPDAEREALAPLPVDALRLTPDAILLLKRLGLRRIGQLYDLPRDALERRFRSENSAKSKARAMADAAGAVLTRLDQALGVSAEPLRALSEPPVVSVRRSWGEPLISSEALLNETGTLVHELCEALKAADLGTRRIRLSLYRADGTVAETVAGLSRASRDAGHLMRLLSEKFGALDAGFGIDVAVLDALIIERAGAQQAALGSDPAMASAQVVAALADRLTNRLGAARIYCLAPQASHIPERAERRVGVAAPHPSPLPVSMGRGGHARPHLLLTPPEPISVMAEVPEGAPMRFTFRRVLHRVVKAQGPERIAPEWWRALRSPAPEATQPLPRDYYTVETADGARFWVFREGLYYSDQDGREPRWFVHGLCG